MAPRVAKPTAPQIAQTAPAPQVAKSTPPPPLVAKASEPPDSGWDDAAQLPSSAVIPAADEARAGAPVVPKAPPSPPPAPAAAPVSPPEPLASKAPAPAAAASPPPAPEPLASKAAAAPAAAASPAPGPLASKAPAAPAPPRAGSSADLASAPRRARSAPDLEPELDVPVTTESAAPPPAEIAARIEGMSKEMQEQLFGVLCAAFDASLLPLLEKQRELEARLERLKQVEPHAAAAAVATAAAPSPMQAPTKVLPLESTPAGPRSVPPKASIIPTSYGFVIESEAPPRRPSIEVALENVGPIDMPDFGRGRRSAGNVLVAILLASVVAAIAATILSYT